MFFRGFLNQCSGQAPKNTIGILHQRGVASPIGVRLPNCNILGCNSALIDYRFVVGDLWPVRISQEALVYEWEMRYVEKVFDSTWTAGSVAVGAARHFQVEWILPLGKTRDIMLWIS